jgi:hypothetical protein
MVPLKRARETTPTLNQSWKEWFLLVSYSSRTKSANFKSKLEGMVPPGKLFIADKKFSCFPNKVAVRNRQDPPDLKQFKRRALARHEALNSHIKKFGCMKNGWRHDRTKHVVFFEFCVVVVQYNLDCGDDHLFDILPPP